MAGVPDGLDAPEVPRVSARLGPRLPALAAALVLQPAVVLAEARATRFLGEDAVAEAEEVVRLVGSTLDVVAGASGLPAATDGADGEEGAAGVDGDDWEDAGVDDDSDDGSDGDRDDDEDEDDDDST